MLPLLGGLRRLLASASVVGQTRGSKIGRGVQPGKGAKYWEGWPRFSPDGWVYARHLKKSHGEHYVSKHQRLIQAGKQKGTLEAAALGRGTRVPLLALLH